MGTLLDFDKFTQLYNLNLTQSRVVTNAWTDDQNGVGNESSCLYFNNITYFKFIEDELVENIKDRMPCSIHIDRYSQFNQQRRFPHTTLYDCFKRYIPDLFLSNINFLTDPNEEVHQEFTFINRYQYDMLRDRYFRVNCIDYTQARFILENICPANTELTITNYENTQLIHIDFFNNSSNDIRRCITHISKNTGGHNNINFMFFKFIGWNI